MNIEFVVMVLVGLVILCLMWWVATSEARCEDEWRHEFTLIMQAKKPLHITTEYIERLACFYIDSGLWLKTDAHIAANKEISRIFLYKFAPIIPSHSCEGAQ